MEGSLLLVNPGLRLFWVWIPCLSATRLVESTLGAHLFDHLFIAIFNLFEVAGKS
jgi:hypothetical protein